MSTVAGEDNWLPLLRAFYRVFQETVELNVVFQRVYEMFPKLLGVSRASILLYDPAIDALVSGDYIGASQPGESHLKSEPQLIGHSISGLCFLEARTIVINDADHQDIIPEVYVRKLALKSSLAVPILYAGKPIGVLRIDDREQKNRFNAELVEWVQLLAGQLAVVIENARLYSSLNQRDRDLRRINEELREAHDGATNMVQAKSSFLARVSHELRTPLNAILGYTELLREDAQVIAKAQFESDLGKINIAANHLMHVITDLLDLSTIEAGKSQVRNDHVELESVISAALAKARASLEKRGNTVRVENPETMRQCYGDPAKLRQVLVTLLSYASRLASGQQLRIALRFHDLPDQPVAELILTQPAVTLNEEQLAGLFQSFHENETASDAEQEVAKEGSSSHQKSLQLAIAQHLCRRMGGDLAAFSDAKHGTAFVIRLPGVVPIN